MSKAELSTAVKNAVGELALVPETRQTKGMLSKVLMTHAMTVLNVGLSNLCTADTTHQLLFRK